MYKDIDAFDGRVHPVLTMGTFDGVHLGHRRIIDEVLHRSSGSGKESALLTFDPHPREVLGLTKSPAFILTTIQEKTEELEKLGLDSCIILNFSRDLSLLSADDFFENIILKKLSPCSIIVGQDHAFGKGRTGDVEMLKALGHKHGIEVSIVEELEMDGKKVSSTAIRHSLASGDVPAANQFLGRSYSFEGLVQRGDGLGSQIGFPTANVQLPTERKLLPATGVYIVRVLLGTTVHRGVMNVGYRPTVSLQEQPSVEVHILDFDSNIYGMKTKMFILARLRDEQKFPDIAHLLEQIKTDIRTAEHWFAHIENSL